MHDELKGHPNPKECAKRRAKAWSLELVASLLWRETTNKEAKKEGTSSAPPQISFFVSARHCSLRVSPGVAASIEPNPMLSTPRLQSAASPPNKTGRVAGGSQRIAVTVLLLPPAVHKAAGAGGYLQPAARRSAILSDPRGANLRCSEGAPGPTAGRISRLSI